jgi:hypothetical protein
VALRERKRTKEGSPEAATERGNPRKKKTQNTKKQQQQQQQE